MIDAKEVTRAQMILINNKGKKIAEDNFEIKSVEQLQSHLSNEVSARNFALSFDDYENDYVLFNGNGMGHDNSMICKLYNSAGEVLDEYTCDSEKYSKDLVILLEEKYGPNCEKLYKC